QDARVHDLGELPHERIADLFCALDVGVIYLRDTVFGRFCFPQKAYEMLACELPIVAGKIGAMADLLAGIPECLYQPESPTELRRCIEFQLANRRLPKIRIESWN